MPLYKIYNSAMATTASPIAQGTGTVIRTMLQVKLGTQNFAKIAEWGISFDGTVANTPIKCELIETGTIFGTLGTAIVAADIVKLGDPNAVDPTTSNIVVGSTSLTAFSTGANTEGTVTASRVFDMQLVPPTGLYVKQWPLGREPLVNVSTCLRIRVTAGTAVNCWCYVDLEI